MEVENEKFSCLDADGSPKFVGIQFCQECNNMLYPKEDKQNKVLLYVCKICDFTQPAINPCVYVNKIVHEVDELQHIISDVTQDPTLPRNREKQCSFLEKNNTLIIFWIMFNLKN